MITALAFVAAAGAGALARAEAGRRWNRHRSMAWGTLAVNVLGAFALGALHELGPPAITVAGVGGLGALTTMSTLARDTVALVEEAQLLRAVLYLGISCAGGVAAAGLGLALAT